MTEDVPAPLAAAFAGRISIGLTEAAELLGINEKTLRSHVKAGNIRYVSIGLGTVRQRRGFRLSDILEFLERMSRRECPPTVPRTRHSTTSASPDESIGFTARRAAILAERKQKTSGGQRRRPA